MSPHGLPDADVLQHPWGQGTISEGDKQPFSDPRVIFCCNRIKSIKWWGFGVILPQTASQLSVSHLRGCCLVSDAWLRWGCASCGTGSLSSEPGSCCGSPACVGTPPHPTSQLTQPAETVSVLFRNVLSGKWPETQSAHLPQAVE